MKNTRKKLLTGLITSTLIMNACIFSTVSMAEDYTDIKGHWAEKLISQLQAKGLVNGIKVNGVLKIEPERTMTRAEFVAMLCRSRQFDVNSDKVIKFTDVKDGSWFKESVDRMTSNSIITGYSDNTFKPDYPITRAEIASIICKAYRLDKVTDPDLGESNGVSDVDVELDTAAMKFSDAAAGSWYYKSVALIKQRGVITGYPNGTFRPDKNATRAECFSIFCKLLNLGTEKPKPTPTPPTVPTPTPTPTPAPTPTPTGNTGGTTVNNPCGLIGYKVTGNAGAKIYYQILAFGVSDLGKFDVKVSYDPRVVKATDVYAGTVKKGNYLSDPDMSTADKGYIIVSSEDATKADNESGTIFTVGFEIQTAASGISDVIMTGINGVQPELYDTSGNLIRTVSVKNGSVTVR